MNATHGLMHKTNLTRQRAFREQKFRIPSPIERELGLWVDRIGASADRGSRNAPRLRLLGQYAAVHILSGQGRFATPRTGELAVTAPDVMLLFPDEPAAYWAETPWSTLWIVWNGEAADRLARGGYLDPRRPVVADRLGVARQAHTALNRVLRAEDRDAALLRKRIVLELVQGLFRATMPQRPAPDARIAEAVARLVPADGPAPSLTRLASELHISPTHLRRLFHAHTGLSPARFRMTRRVSRAKELLSAGVPMKAVAAQTGFGDVFHFMRAFKRTVGMTPGRFAALERGSDLRVGPD